MPRLPSHNPLQSAASSFAQSTTYGSMAAMLPARAKSIIGGKQAPYRLAVVLVGVAVRYRQAHRAASLAKAESLPAMGSKDLYINSWHIVLPSTETYTGKAAAFRTIYSALRYNQRELVINSVLE